MGVALQTISRHTFPDRSLIAGVTTLPFRGPLALGKLQRTWHGAGWTEGQRTYNATLRRFRVTVVFVVEEQKVLRVLSVCLLALVTQHAALMCHIFLSVACVRLYNIFTHYLIKGTIFKNKKLLVNTKCVFWFPLQLLPETFLIPRRNERDMIKNVHRSSCKVPVILVRF